MKRGDFYLHPNGFGRIVQWSSRAGHVYYLTVKKGQTKEDAYETAEIRTATPWEWKRWNNRAGFVGPTSLVRR